MNEPCPKCRVNGRDHTGDNLHRYPDGTGFCFHPSCRTFFAAGSDSFKRSTSKGAPVSKLTLEDVAEYPYGTSPERKISIDVARHYGVRHSVNTSTGEPETIYYPSYSPEGKLIGYAVRKLPKDFRPCVGKIGKAVFGKNTIKSTNRTLLITEGQEDCLAAAEILGKSKVNIVAAPNGASMCPAISDEADMYASHDKVFICFDADKAGKAGAEQIADFLSPMVEVRIVNLPDGYDISDLLKEGKQSEFKKAIREAEVYEPDGIVNGVDLVLSEVFKPLPDGYPIPFKGLQEKLHGVRKGEILTVCAGSGIGKSTLVREIAKSLIEQDVSIANIALEDRMEDAAKHLVALDMNIPFHQLKFRPPPLEEIKPHMEKMCGNGKTFFYKHFAGITADSLMNKLYYYARSKAVDFIILDHLSMVISATETNNERKAIDTLMTNLAKMIVETGVGLIQIVHLRRSGGDKSFAKGGEVELTDLRGSAALEQLSWAVVALERDQQGESKDFSVARVLKNRTYGFTGLADRLKYDAATGRMHSVEPEDISDEEYEETTKSF